jgi:hypothetical protein
MRQRRHRGGPSRGHARGTPGVFEYQVQADLEHAFARAGCTEVATAPSWPRPQRGGSPLPRELAKARRRSPLVVRGAECHGYTADVTRTFPVSVRFTARQRDIYEIVLAAQNRCIGKARAGTTSLDLQRLSEETLAEGLRGLRLLAGSVSELVETEAIRVFYPHGNGHALGLDVHDAEGGRRRRLPKPRFAKVRFRARLEPGFVITVEPGIYFMPALLHDPEVRRGNADGGLRPGRVVPRPGRGADRGRRGDPEVGAAEETHHGAQDGGRGGSGLRSLEGRRDLFEVGGLDEVRVEPGVAGPLAVEGLPISR